MGIEAMHTKRLVRYMMYLPGGEIRRPTTDVHQALRLVEVSLLPPQLPRQQLLLSDIDCGTDIAFKSSLFNNGIRDDANIPHLPVRSDNSVRYIADAMLFMHRLDFFGNEGSILWVDVSQTLLKAWGAVLRIKAENPI